MTVFSSTSFTPNTPAPTFIYNEKLREGGTTVVVTPTFVKMEFVNEKGEKTYRTFNYTNMKAVV